MTQLCKTAWFLPAFSLLLGAGMLAAEWVGGDPYTGLGALGVMAVLGAVLLLGGRSETIRGLRGDGRDERFAAIDVRASAAAGTAVIAAVIVGFLVEVARGHDGAPYTWLAAVGGLVYLAAIVVQRLRG